MTSTAAPLLIQPNGGWKYVDESDAHYIEQGSLKLGTMRDYRTLENGRGDRFDSAVAMHSGRIVGQPGSLAALKRMGVDTPWEHDSQVFGSVFMGNTNAYYAEPFYGFCLSRCGCTYDPRPEVPKAVFEVSNLIGLAIRLLQLHGDRLGRWHISYVTYSQVEVEAQSDDVLPAPSPFVKGLRFAPEQEIRLIFSPIRHDPTEALFTKPDPAVARFFTRLS